MVFLSAAMIFLIHLIGKGEIEGTLRWLSILSLLRGSCNFHLSPACHCCFLAAFQATSWSDAAPPRASGRSSVERRRSGRERHMPCRPPSHPSHSSCSKIETQPQPKAEPLSLLDSEAEQLGMTKIPLWSKLPPIHQHIDDVDVLNRAAQLHLAFFKKAF